MKLQCLNRDEGGQQCMKDAVVNSNYCWEHRPQPRKLPGFWQTIFGIDPNKKDK